MWLNKTPSLYTCYSDNYGRPLTYRSILLSQVAVAHKCWFYDLEKNRPYRGESSDITTIIKLRNLDKADPRYEQKKRMLKSTLQCFTPAALLGSKKKGHVQELERTGMMQLDFDYKDICQYDIEELKQCVFGLPFIAFCSLSCSGDGFYALALISEPDKLAEYAAHCFEVLLSYGIKADTSKGKKIENLRYISYDANMLIRENPEPLRISHFKAKPAPKKLFQSNPYRGKAYNNGALVDKELKALSQVTPGSRFATVQKSAFTLGGLNSPDIIYQVENAILSNQSFYGEEAKYLKVARDCFEAGMQKPLITQS